MNWPLVPQQFVTGLLNGGTIGLIALGIVLIYKSSEVFNFAHGHLVMFGAFLTWWFSGGGAEAGSALIDLPLWAALIAALIVSLGIGLLIERFALRPMTGQPLLPRQRSAKSCRGRGGSPPAARTELRIWEATSAWRAGVRP